MTGLLAWKDRSARATTVITAREAEEMPGATVEEEAFPGEVDSAEVVAGGNLFLICMS